MVCSAFQVSGKVSVRLPARFQNVTSNLTSGADYTRRKSTRENFHLSSLCTSTSIKSGRTQARNRTYTISLASSKRDGASTSTVSTPRRSVETSTPREDESQVPEMQDFTDGVKQDILEKIKIIHKPPMPLTQGLLYVNLTALLFGTSAVLIKSASETDMPPEYTLPLRFTIAALCFAPQIVRGLKDARIRDAGVWK